MANNTEGQDREGTGGFAQKPVPFTILNIKKTRHRGSKLGMILSNKAVCSSTTLPPTSTAAVVCTFMKVAESAPITKIPMMLAAFANFFCCVAHVNHRRSTCAISHEHQAKIEKKVNNLVQKKKTNGPAIEPSIAIDAPNAKVSGINVIWSIASPIPPVGPIPATFMTLTVEGFSLFSSMATAVPSKKVNNFGLALKNCK